jgi:hypothetical protein
MPGITLDTLKSDAELEEVGTLVHVNDVNGQPAFYGPEDGRKPVTVRIAGALSKTYRRAEQAFNAAGGTGRSRKNALARLLDWRAIDVTAGCILSWEGFFHDAAEKLPLPLTKENAAAVLEVAPYILSQLIEEQGDHSGFSPSASASC